MRGGGRGGHRLSAAEMQPTDSQARATRGRLNKNTWRCAHAKQHPRHTNKSKLSRTSPQTRRQPVSCVDEADAPQSSQYIKLNGPRHEISFAAIVMQSQSSLQAYLHVSQ